MSYIDTLLKVNTAKALELLKIDIKQTGAYIYFECPNCQGKAVIKAYGEKKNLVYCTTCKKSWNLISLTEQLLKMTADSAKSFLERAAITTHKLTEPPKTIYELEYHDYLQAQGLSKEICEFMGIGVPKGKSMLAGHVAFTIHNEDGQLIAYYGIRIKDGRPSFYHTFNPELYLYQFSNLSFDREVTLCTNLFDCVRRWLINKQAVCNFGLPYLSSAQLDLLNRLKHIEFCVPAELKKSFAFQAMEKLEAYYRFAA